MEHYLDQHSKKLIELSIEEDLGEDRVDITTEASISPLLTAKAVLIAKEDAVIFGHEVAEAVFKSVNSNVEYEVCVNDGNFAKAGDVLSEVKGPYKAILTAERTALNFLQRLSAVATLTNNVVSKIKPFQTQILDTRKTTPAYRTLEKAAVMAGGGHNHRQGLYDQFLIKNNHVDSLKGDIVEAIQSCRRYNPALKLKVEVRDRNEVRLALSQNPEGLLLDNFSPMELTTIVKEIREQVAYNNIILEASGGINLDNVKEYAASGVDQISLGFLTHSAQSIDISLRFREAF